MESYQKKRAIGDLMQIRNMQPMMSKKKKISYFLEPLSLDAFLFYFYPIS